MLVPVTLDLVPLTLCLVSSLFTRSEAIVDRADGVATALARSNWRVGRSASVIERQAGRKLTRHCPAPCSARDRGFQVRVLAALQPGTKPKPAPLGGFRHLRTHASRSAGHRSKPLEFGAQWRATGTRASASDALRVSYFELAGSELATPSRSTASTTRAETRELAHLLGEERDRAPDGLSTPTPWQVVPSPSA